MTDKPNIPFMPQKGKPPLHLRDWTPGEMEQHHRMLVHAERRARESGIETRVEVEPASK